MCLRSVSSPLHSPSPLNVFLVYPACCWAVRLKTWSSAGQLQWGHTPQTLSMALRCTGKLEHSPCKPQRQRPERTRDTYCCILTGEQCEKTHPFKGAWHLDARKGKSSEMSLLPGPRTSKVVQLFKPMYAGTRKSVSLHFTKSDWHTS